MANTITLRSLNTFIFISFAVCASPRFSQAQEILVEATALSENRIEPSRSSQTITAADIERLQPQTVADALRLVPGLQVVRQGGAGQTTSVFIRGARSEDTLVLIDGVPANDAMAPSTGYDFSNLPPDSIERIEVYRGPQGVRFGSGALGGVINIISKEGTASRTTQYLFEGGTFQTGKAHVQTGSSVGQWRYSLGAEAFKTEGISAARTTNRDGDDDSTQVHSLTGKLNWAANTNWNIETTARWIDTENEIDLGGGDSGEDPNNRSESNHFLGGVKSSHRFFSEQLKTTIGFYFAEMVRDGRNRPDALSTDSSSDHFRSMNTRFAIENELLLGEDHTLRLNLDAREERGRSSSLSNGTFTDVGGHDQSVAGVSLTYLFEDARWFYDIGVRGDDTETAGSIASYRASFGRKWNEQKAYLAYGTGYKLPSLYQLYSIYGDRSLKEETSQAFEATYEMKPADALTASLTYFENEYSDLIDFNSATSRYFNVSEAESRGIELQSRFQIVPSWSFSANYAYLESSDKSTGRSLLRRPRNAWGLEAQYAREKWDAFTQYRFRGKRKDIDPATFDRMTGDSYDWVALGIGYRLSKALRAHARIENAFDRDYEEIAGYETAGRAFYAGLSGEL